MTDLRIEPREDGTLDEVYAREPLHVHLEQMSNKAWCLIIDLRDGRQVIVNLNTKSQRIYAQADIEGAR